MQFPHVFPTGKNGRREPPVYPRGMATRACGQAAQTAWKVCSFDRGGKREQFPQAICTAPPERSMVFSRFGLKFGKEFNSKRVKIMDDLLSMNILFALFHVVDFCYFGLEV